MTRAAAVLALALTITVGSACGAAADTRHSERTPARATPTATGAAVGPTARCRDGSYSYSRTHSGTCSHHGGVAQWYR